MTTLSDLINETRDLLYTNQQPYSNRLSGAISSTSATTFACHYNLGPMAQQGCIVAIDLELIRVWETSGTTVHRLRPGVNEAA